MYHHKAFGACLRCTSLVVCGGSFLPVQLVTAHTGASYMMAHEQNPCQRVIIGSGQGGVCQVSQLLGVALGSRLEKLLVLAGQARLHQYALP